MLDLTCTICLEEINSIQNKKTLRCEHMFHEKCILEYYNYQYTPNNFIKIDTKCPVCKKPINDLEFTNLEFNNNIIIEKFTKTPYGFNKIFLKRNSLNDLLQKHDIKNVIEFNNLLDQNMIISGTFILNILLNTPVDKIFSNEVMTIYINKNEFSNKFKQLEKILENNYNRYDDYENQILQKYQFCHKNDLNKLKIQIIVPLKKNIKSFIRDYMPFNILKNYYDGEKFYVYDPTKIIYKIEILDYTNNNYIGLIKQLREIGIQMQINNN